MKSAKNIFCQYFRRHISVSCNSNKQSLYPFINIKPFGVHITNIHQLFFLIKIVPFSVLFIPWGFLLIFHPKTEKLEFCKVKKKNIIKFFLTYFVLQTLCIFSLDWNELEFIIQTLLKLINYQMFSFQLYPVIVYKKL